MTDETQTTASDAEAMFRTPERAPDIDTLRVMWPAMDEHERRFVADRVARQLEEWATLVGIRAAQARRHVEDLDIDDVIADVRTAYAWVPWVSQTTEAYNAEDHFGYQGRCH